MTAKMTIVWMEISGYLTIILQLQEPYNKYPARFIEIYQGIIQEFSKWECKSVLF